MKVTNKCSQLSCLGSAMKHLGRKHHSLGLVFFVFLMLWVMFRMNVKVLSLMDFTSVTTQSSKTSRSSGYDGTGNAILSLLQQNKTACNDCFVGYGEEFALLKNVVLDPFKNKAFQQEGIGNNWNPPKDIVPTIGYFSMDCRKGPSYHFKGDNHLNDWLSITQFQEKKHVNSSIKAETYLTIAVKRYEYANFFHSMTDFYNAFLMMKLFKSTPEKTKILLFDTNPQGMLIDIWHKLFENTTMAKNIREPILFKNLVWSIIGYNSPLTPYGVTSLGSQILFSMFGDWTPFWIYSNPLISYLSDFKKFFLSQYNMNDYKNLNCKNLSVLFIWRHDYVAHKGNPSGLISRKIKNEKELLQSVRNLLVGHHVMGVQIDKLTVRQQLQQISQTDILIGMHGAGLSHTLFLPDHAALIELYPRYWPTTNVHFRCMATWRNLTYFSWQNTDYLYEKKHYYTYIPPLILSRMVKKVRNKICPSKA